MKNKLLWFVLSIALAAQAAAFEATPASAPVLKPQPEQSQAAHLSAAVLTKYHYKAMPLDDAMSEKIFDRYLKALDSEKLIFVQDDIGQLSSARTRLDDAIIDKDLSLPFTIFNLYTKRVWSGLLMPVPFWARRSISRKKNPIVLTGKKRPGRPVNKKCANSGASVSRMTG